MRKSTWPDLQGTKFVLVQRLWLFYKHRHIKTCTDKSIQICFDAYHLCLNAHSPTAWKHHTIAHCYQLYSLRYCYAYLCSFVMLLLWFFFFLICHPTVNMRSMLVFSSETFVFQHFLHHGVPYLSISHNNHGLFHLPSTQRRPLCFDVFRQYVHQLCKNIAFVWQKWTRPPKTFLCAILNPLPCLLRRDCFKKVNVCDIFHIIRQYLHS